MLRDLEIKSVYSSDEDNLLEDFYIPALRAATLYQRSVGYFSASVLSYAAQAISSFVTNGGKMQLIVGAFVSTEEFGAVQDGYRKKEIGEQLGQLFLEQISDIDSELFQCRLEALAWLVSHDILSIKVAIRRQGLFHEKVGVVTDESGDKLVFSGSANESNNALLPDYNFESINVFQSWREELRDHWEPHVAKFERLWENEATNTAVIEFPEAARKKLVSISQALDEAPKLEMEQEIWERISSDGPAADAARKPRIPKQINGIDFKIREHQVKALNKWKANDYLGILALATGAGKTVTSIYGVVQIAQNLEHLTVVIAVPYQDLADQWCEVLALFNIYPIKCYRSRSNWENRLASAAHFAETGAAKFVAIVVVNRTLKSETFQNYLQNFDPNSLFFIGDECHHHGSSSFAGNVPLDARFRLGLSATPEHYLDDERNDNLNRMYGGIVDTYSLSDAVGDGILTPYEYTVVPVDLTQEETEEYIELSGKIGRMFAAAKNGATIYHESTSLQSLIRQRSRLVASAKNKLTALKDLLQTYDAPVSHSLFYCGDGMIDADDDNEENDQFGLRQIEAVSLVLERQKWSNSHFTARENKRQREDILRDFKSEYIDSLVAIKCLDEGIDIPACSTAFILASSRDPRQFIQRRGRILRRSQGKELAKIYDFLVVFPEMEEDEKDYSRRLFVGEMERVAEFASLSINRHECYMQLRPLLQHYSLEHLI